MNIETIKKSIEESKDLDALCDALNAAENLHGTDTRLEDIVDLPGLPTFGGTEPRHIDNVWSWDATRCMSHDGNVYRIEAREDV